MPIKEIKPVKAQIEFVCDFCKEKKELVEATIRDNYPYGPSHHPRDWSRLDFFIQYVDSYQYPDTVFTCRPCSRIILDYIKNNKGEAP